MKVLLVDPSLFTAPYDAALSEGLLSAGIEPVWAIRPLREGEHEEIAGALAEPVFYRRVDALSSFPARARSTLKGLAHLRGLCRLVRRACEAGVEVVHFQWSVLPLADSVAIRWLQRAGKAVVVTVHDTVPFNGDRLAALQTLGFYLPAKTADRVIVHTQAAAEALAAHGIERSKIGVVPHGPLSLKGITAARGVGKLRDARWTFVMFGQIKPYKGLDVLIEAVRALPPSLLEQARFIVAGLPRMAMAELQARIAAANLNRHFDLRLYRLDDAEIVELLDSADTFVFPYRQVDASGAFYLVRGWGKWIIASSVGVFAEELAGSDGAQLVAAADVSQLSSALAAAIAARPAGRPPERGISWREIGALTRRVYCEAQASRRTGAYSELADIAHARSLSEFTPDRVGAARACSVQRALSDGETSAP